MKRLWVGAAIVILLFPIVAVVGGVAVLGEDPCAPYRGLQDSVDAGIVPEGDVAGYRGKQLQNAAHIAQAGKDAGLSMRDQRIGIMTAMGESGLRVLDYGDTVGPDSRGLFQQRDSWGPLSDRMDPYKSAAMFFERLAGIEERNDLEPTIAAHRVQRNADPWHYARWWEPAGEVLAAIGSSNPGGSIQIPPECRQGGGPGNSGDVNAEGWAAPGKGPITSTFGPRVDPITGAAGGFHTGTDLGGGGCGGPIWSANDGIVIERGFDSNGSGVIAIDHGSGIVTRYLHMYANGMHVNVGDQVTGGQHIADVGSSGWSTACHLHFEVIRNGQNVDPQPFMRSVGITLGGTA